MIIKQSQVRIEDRPPEGHDKRVELLREEGVVRALEVRCSCGEITVVDFDYEDPVPAPAPAPTNPS